MDHKQQKNWMIVVPLEIIVFLDYDMQTPLHIAPNPSIQLLAHKFYSRILLEELLNISPTTSKPTGFAF